MKLQDVTSKAKMTVDKATYRYPVKWWQLRRRMKWDEARDRIIRKNKELGNTKYKVDNKSRTITFEVEE